jgi:hypothetical protein
VHVQGKQVLLARSRLFEFDHAFGPDASQQLVYDSCARGLVRAAFRGYNCTVMAYGQTGSGKTYSMGSSSNSGVSENALGIIPRVVHDLYAQVEIAAGRGVRVETRVSYLEIYNEELRDLLHPSAAAGAGAGAGSLASTGSGGGAAGFGRGFAPSQPSSGITIREDVAGGVVLTGVREERVESFADIARALHRGGVGRTTGSTLMNQHSSRSHSIFTINIVQTRLADAAQASSGRAALARKSEVTKSKFHLVDRTLLSPAAEGAGPRALRCPCVLFSLSFSLSLSLLPLSHDFFCRSCVPCPCCLSQWPAASAPRRPAQLACASKNPSTSTAVCSR